MCSLHAVARYCAVIAAVFLFGAGCDSSAPLVVGEPTVHRYVLDELDVSFELPDGWIVEEATAGTEVPGLTYARAWLVGSAASLREHPRFTGCHIASIDLATFDDFESWVRAHDSPESPIPEDALTYPAWHTFHPTRQLIFGSHGAEILTAYYITLPDTRIVRVGYSALGQEIDASMPVSCTRVAQTLRQRTAE